MSSRLVVVRCPLGIKAIAFAVVGVVLVVGGVSALALVNSKERKSSDVYTPSPTAVHGAFMTALGAYPEVIHLQTSFVTIQGASKPKSWSLRGSFPRENRNIPIFAALSHVCDTESDAPNCWRLEELTVDGRDIPTGTPSLSSASSDANRSTSVGQSSVSDGGSAASNSQSSNAGSNSATDTADVPERVETPYLKTSTSAPEETVASGPSTDASASSSMNESQSNSRETAAAPPQTEENTFWRTTSDIANARLAPSLDGQVAFKMSSGVPLTLVEERGTWGLFEYPAANDQRGRVWIHMDVVERIGN